MTLRAALHTDAASIAAISIEVWIGTYLKQGVDAFFAEYALSEFTRVKIEQRLADPRQRFLVSQNTDGIDGFIALSFGQQAPVPNCADTEISTLYVQPRHHGKGIGKRLLSAALTQCRACAIPSVWLATNAQNAPAIGFYCAQGFAQVGQTQFRIKDQGYLNNVYCRHLA